MSQRTLDWARARAVNTILVTLYRKDENLWTVYTLAKMLNGPGEYFLTGLGSKVRWWHTAELLENFIPNAFYDATEWGGYSPEPFNFFCQSVNRTSVGIWWSLAFLNCLWIPEKSSINLRIIRILYTSPPDTVLVIGLAYKEGANNWLWIYINSSEIYTAWTDDIGVNCLRRCTSLVQFSSQSTSMLVMPMQSLHSKSMGFKKDYCSRYMNFVLRPSLPKWQKADIWVLFSY